MPGKILLKQITWSVDIERFMLDALGDDRKKIKNMVMIGKAQLYLIENMGFVILKENGEYCDILAGKKFVNIPAIESVGKCIVHHAKSKGLITRVQTMHMKIANKFFNLGFDVINIDPDGLIKLRCN